MSKLLRTAAVLAVAATLSLTLSAAADQRYGIGRAATPQEISGWDIDVRGGDGKGLPPGKGSVQQGEQLFSERCASCHGDFGEGNGRMPELVGGGGSLAKDAPIKTVGSYWPYAPTLFDYIRRAMPFTTPETLTNDQVYALTAYILQLNGIVPQGTVLDAPSLAAIVMPNRNGFVPDPRPDVHNVACMTNCKRAPVTITSDLARTLQVTPSQKAQDAPTASGSGTTAAGSGPSAAAKKDVSFASVQRIVAVRCTVCHAGKPTQAGITAPPAGMKFDTPEQIRAAAARIKARAVATQGMPLGNVTHMTADERAVLGDWIAGGAKL
jgi:cytochrome c